MRAIISSFILVISIFISSFLFSDNILNESKSITFSDDIAPILYDNCAACHHDGGIAPFSLITYNDAFNNRTMIQYMTENGYMPPWPPDTNYSRFSHERTLSANEISMIQSWVAAGAPQGDSTSAPPYPTYTTAGPTLGTPDMTISAPVYTSNAVNHDDYVCFVIPSGLTQNRKIRAVEIIPGNPEIVHHCIVYVDTSGVFQTDTSGHCMGPTSGKIIGEYAPGSSPTIFPGDSNLAFAVDIEAGSNVILSMHYPHGSLGMTDSSTKVHFYFYPETFSNFRTLSIQPIISNFNFCVPANTVQTYVAQFPTNGTSLPGNWSVFGIFPHMHLLGESIQCYSVNSVGDTLPLINIPAWDFEWQGFYKYPYLQKIESGSVVKANATYDNTVNNPHNPNDPPQLVCAGLNTTDEMFLVYFLFTSYYQGDETLNMDSLAANSSLNILENNNVNWQVSAYPNPSSEQVRFAFNLDHPSNVTLQIMDLNGKIVYQRDYGKFSTGLQHVFYNVNSDRNQPAGTYLYYLKAGENRNFGKIIIQ